jgi:uncharacterized protein
MKDTLHYIITAIVDKPESVVIEESEVEGTIEFTISVDSSDMGKIIGKEGRMIRSIRNVMKVPAIKEGKRIHVGLAEQV